MADSPLDPRRVDIPTFAKSGHVWRQSVPLAQFARVVASADTQAAVPAASAIDIVAAADAQRRHGVAQYGLALAARGALSMTCQRCLAPVEVRLEVDRRFLFAPDEPTAAALDADIDDDVLALEQPFDLLSLVEDELLLAMPLVPVHDVCPAPLLAPVDRADGPAMERDHPFAALAKLKRPMDGGQN